MIDYHVHIGQYFDSYFYADRVFQALKNCGINEIWFSSTTSCIYCKESPTAQSDKTIYNQAPTAEFLYENLISEAKDALCAANEIKLKAHALYWVVPEIIFSGIDFEDTMNNFPFDGFKIHTVAQNWDLKNPRIFELAENVFNYANKHNKKILIHTGSYPEVSPQKFELFIKENQDAKIQLAHCRDFNGMEKMLLNYKNVIADNSDSIPEVEEKLKQLFPKTVVFGSDFPPIHQFFGDPEIEELEKYYKEINIH